MNPCIESTSPRSRAPAAAAVLCMTLLALQAPAWSAAPDDGADTAPSAEETARRERELREKLQQSRRQLQESARELAELHAARAEALAEQLGDEAGRIAVEAVDRAMSELRTYYLDSSSINALTATRLELAPLTPELGRYFGTDEGLLIVAGADAFSDALQDGDVILAIDGEQVVRTRGVLRRLLDDEGDAADPGQHVFDIMRDGREQSVTVVPKKPDLSQRSRRGAQRWWSNAD